MDMNDAIRQKIGQIHHMLAGELPPPTHEAGGCQDSLVPCRDGAGLMTRTVLPAGAGPWPVIVSRNPYTPVDTIDGLNSGILALVRYGYAVVYQQVRGLYRSQGEWYAFEREREDGLDLLEWTASQPWCDGRICLYGGSYLGHVIWAMADALPPQVKTIYTLVWGDDPYGSFYENGMFKQAIWTLWAAQMMHPEDRSDLSQPDLDGFRRALDAETQMEADLAVCGRPCPWYRGWISNSCRSDPYWKQGVWKNYAAAAQRIHIPVLLQTGWFDIFLEPTWRVFSHLAPEVRARSRLVVGPWHHGNAAPAQPDFPGEGRFGLFQVKLALEWFDAVLTSRQDRPSGVDAYVMGAGEWRHWRDIPASKERRRLCLRPGQGSCHLLAPEAGQEEASLTYRYDPLRPVPSRGGKLLMNYNEWTAEPECAALQPPPGARDDVCSFLSPPLDAPVTVVGAPTVRLAVSSDAPDTAFTAKLMEVRPDGCAVSICDGISTLAFRDGDHRRQPYTPGQRAEVEFPLPVTAWRFPAGSRIRMDVSSSNYPAFHRHPNTNRPWAQESPCVPASQTLYLGAASWIELPLV